MYTMRRLSATDTSTLQVLNALFGEVFEDAKSYELHKPSASYLRTFLEDSNHIVLVAEANKGVVGGLVAYCLTKFEQERKEVYVYDLAVAPSYQRHGIGKNLIEAIQKVAKGMGAYVVFVQADEGDKAINFYEAMNPSENIKTRNFDFNI